jgi:DNA-directed RNA polymerase alpha subunit
MNKVFISCKESKIENNRSFYGCFLFGFFDYGLSLTIANALRRTLLSECSGLSIVSVTIENVSHEYSTLSGVRESVLDILLNLKEIVLKKSKVFSYPLVNLQEATPQEVTLTKLVQADCNDLWYFYKKESSIYNEISTSYFRPLIGYLKVKGPGVIRAKDLILPSFIQCVDPEQYIATLSEDAILCMKLVIKEGKIDYVQKKNSFINLNLIKKRQTFLNELFDFQIQEEIFNQKNISLSSPSPLPVHLPSAPEGGKGKGKGAEAKEGEAKVSAKRLPAPAALFAPFDSEAAVPARGKTASQKGSGPVSLFEANLSLRQPRRGCFAGANPKLVPGQKLKQTAKDKNPKTKSKTLFANSYALYLDTVFNPVIKVNYIIEENWNNLISDSYKKTRFVDEMLTLIESSDYLQKNLPFLISQLSLNQSNEWWERLETLNVLDNKLGKLVNMYDIGTLENLSNSFHPLEKEKKNYNIMLEIWTNGSIHPSEVLKIALNKLSSVFLNFQKTLFIHFSRFSSFPLSSK